MVLILYVSLVLHVMPLLSAFLSLSLTHTGTRTLTQWQTLIKQVFA